MRNQASVFSIAFAFAFALALASATSAAHNENSQTVVSKPSEASGASKSVPQSTPPQAPSRATQPQAKVSLPCQAFTRPPVKPHDPSDLLFTFDQLEHWYRVPGEYTHRLVGDQYGFESLSLIISETHPGGGPGLHVHDTEEAHVLLQGSAQYRIGEKTITVQAPYVAKVPAGVPHTFINVGTEPFNLIAVFATKNPTTTRVGPHPLVPLWESQNTRVPCSTSK
jgi:mannose-6-phosphate isomerase-like protein (cupin superfamily)